jgi:hypothetical protein
MKIILDTTKISKADFVLDGSCGPPSSSSLRRVPGPRKFSWSSVPERSLALPKVEVEDGASSTEVRDIVMFEALVLQSLSTTACR